MKKIIISLQFLYLCLCMVAGCGQSAREITDMTINDKEAPVVIDTKPYFGWKMQSEEKGAAQSAYRIVVSEEKEGIEKKQYLWDSGKVMSDISVAIPYMGKELEAEQDYFWQVTVWDQNQEQTESEIAEFEMGKTEDVWENTQWISYAAAESLNQEEAPILETYASETIANEKTGKETISEINYTFKMDQTVTGFLWGAEREIYGKYYRWSFDATGENVELVMACMNGEKVVESEVSVLREQSVEEFLETSHSVRICVEGKETLTYVDDKLISRNNIVSNFTVGEIGFWVERGEKNAWYDNIFIKDREGILLYEEKFENAQHIFKPYYLKIENGWGRADSGFIFTPGSEIPAPMFRKTFTTLEDSEVASVRMYITSLGIFDLYINGKDVNPYYGAPGQSVYSEEVYYCTYDLTEHIVPGSNGIGVMLGHGRYDRAKGAWGNQLALYAQIVVQYQDGTRQIIGTDDSWQVCTDGPIRRDDLFRGEYYDANYAMEHWTMPEFDEGENGRWKNAQVYEIEKEPVKKAMPDAGVKEIERRTAVAVTEPVKGVYVYDFGQNFNGICNLQLTGKKGETVTMRYGEYLNHESLDRKDDENGMIWTRNLCTADNTDYYTFKEDGTVCYSPTFSYRGFRYLQIEGLEQPPSLEEVQGIVLSTDNTRTGYFECSDEGMNRLYETIYVSQMSNYVDIPTDCPQRDERLGWTGDAQVFAYTGALNANTANFIYKYIDALRVSQNEDGSYPQIVPFVDKIGGANGWSDAGIILVWEMYQQYGNKRIIEENLSAMCSYMDYLVKTSPQYIREFKGYNDHNALSYMEDGCMNTAQCAYVANLLTKMCEIAGEAKLAEKYRDIYEEYLDEWQKHYLKEDGSIGNWYQSEYVLALAYGLYPKDLEQAGADRLNISVESNDYHITTGYVTTPHILSMLCKYGYMETAYKVIQQTGYSSWNYMLDQGVCSLTEGWNTISLTEDGKTKINGSLNHVALGAVGQWFYTDVLGIRRDESEPAYKHFYLEPKLGGGLTYARGSYESVYGKIESAWEVCEEGIKFRFVIPANTSATVTLPGEEYQEMELEAGSYEFLVEDEESFGKK